LSIILLILGLILVIKGAGLLVDGGSSLARRMRISELVVGLTVVAFGTSLPELSVNIAASIKGSAEIAITNVLGSNVANILLILGFCSVIFPLLVTHGTVWKEIPLSLLAAVVLGILAGDRVIDNKEFSELTRIDGLVLLSFFFVFLYYSVGIAKRESGVTDQLPRKNYDLKKSIVYILSGLVLLILGGKFVVDGAVSAASRLNINESVIGATVVAIGTSIPELATSAVAAYRKNPDIAVGNVIGSNIFNIFFVLGLSSIIRPLPIRPSDSLHIFAAIFASLVLFICMFTGKKKIIDRWEGWLLMACYSIYILLTIIQK